MARGRERLCLKVGKAVRDGAAVMIYASQTEQGFSGRSLGDSMRVMTDSEGLVLPTSYTGAR